MKDAAVNLGVQIPETLHSILVIIWPEVKLWDRVVTVLRTLPTLVHSSCMVCVPPDRARGFSSLPVLARSCFWVLTGTVRCARCSHVDFHLHFPDDD